MRQRRRLDNEDGAVLVIALMMLVLLTILGIAISTTSEVELQIADNERRHKQVHYRAEAAAMQAANLFDFDPDLNHDADPDDWIYDTGGVSLDQVRSWNEDDGDYIWDESETNSASSDLENTRYVAVFNGTPLGEQIGEIFEYTIYARSFGTRGARSIINIGYRRATSQE
jgi:hypothetical protein